MSSREELNNKAPETRPSHESAWETDVIFCFFTGKSHDHVLLENMCSYTCTFYPLGNASICGTWL